MKNYMLRSFSGIFIIFLFMNCFVQAQSWDKTQPNILFATDKSHRFENVKVGIGTNTPLFQLEVKGKIVTDSMHIHGKLQIGDSTFSFVPNVWNTQPFLVDHIRSDNGRIALMEGDNSIFSSDIKVGIGTDIPFEFDNALFGLEVTGDINITGANNTGTYLNHGYRIRGVTVLQTQWNNFNTASMQNIFVGETAGINNTSGGNNTFVGFGAGRSNISGTNNTFVGRTAGDLSATGSGNVYVGDDAGHINTNATGRNTFIGSRAGFGVVGERNSFLGFSAGDDMTGGNGNIIIGEASGTNLQTGNGNIFVGQNTGVLNVTTATNSSIIGTGATVQQDNVVILGNNAQRIGIGLSDATITTDPFVRLEIDAGVSGTGQSPANNGRSGLRFRDLRYSNDVTAGFSNKVLTVDNDGDVILVDAPGGGANICTGMFDNRLTKFIAGTNELCNSMVYDNDFSVGIGNFAPGTNLSAVFTVNSNAGLVPPSGTFSLGEVFTTDCPNVDTYWRMCRGGNQKGRIYSPVTGPGGGTEDLIIEAPNTGSNIIFRTGQTISGNSISRMIIVDGPDPNAQTGFVGIGNDFYTPKSILHLNDGINNTFLQITNNSTGPNPGDGIRLGIISTTGVAVLNQQEDNPLFLLSNNTNRMSIWHSATNETRVGIGTGTTLAERALEVFDGNNPQLRLSRAISGHERFTDFETTPAGHLRINPNDGGLFQNNGRVGINLIAGAEPQNTVEINSGPASPSPSGLRFTNLNSFATPYTNPGNGVLTVDEDGDVVYVEASSGNFQDFDWEHLPQGVFSGHPNSGGFNDQPVYVGYTPTTINQIPLPTEFAVFYDEGGAGNLAFTGSVTSFFHNHYNDPNALPNSAASAVVGFSNGNRCITKGINYGCYFRAENAVENYGGFFITPHNCGNMNYGIWAETEIGDGFAGNFDGDLNYTGTLTPPSDSKLKKDIYPITEALTKIRLLTPRTYTFRYDEFQSINLPHKQQFGFIAQEVEPFLPELVSEIIYPAEFDTLGNMVSDSIHYKTLNYIGLIPILAEGIKELADITDSLAALPNSEDKDWEYIDTAGVFTGYNNSNGYNKRSVYIGITPSLVPNLERPVKFGVIANNGSIGPNGEFGLVAGGFRNMITHSNQGTASKAYGLYAEASSNGCVTTESKNYGISARADNAYQNYAGYFQANASGSCSTVNYGVYSTCPSTVTNNYAGYFNGNLAYTGNLSYQSDIRLKENIVPVINALDVMNQLNPVSFNFKKSQYPTMNMPEGTHFGLIAQDVEPVLPDVVSNNFFPAQYDDNGTMLSDSFSYKSIDYTKLIPHMIEAIQELSEQNQNLQTQVDQLQNILASCCTETRNSSVNVTIETRPVVVPSQNTVLNQNQPNPFKTYTVFTYTLGESGKCELVIEDTYGRTIATLLSENQQTGNYSVEWEASTQPAGIYFYSLRVNGKVLVKKAIKIE